MRAPRKNVLFTRPVSSCPSKGEYPCLDSDSAARTTKLSCGSTRAMSASKPGAISPLLRRPKRTAGLKLNSSAIWLYDRPRLLPSLSTPESRYSVPPNPDLASQILVGSSLDHFCSLEQQAWSLTIQSILRASTACHNASTSSRGRIGGLTLASPAPPHLRSCTHGA